MSSVRSTMYRYIGSLIMSIRDIPKGYVQEVYKGIMSIPLYPKLTDQDVEDVIHAVKKIVEAYRK